MTKVHGLPSSSGPVNLVRTFRCQGYPNQLDAWLRRYGEGVVFQWIHGGGGPRYSLGLYWPHPNMNYEIDNA